MNKNTSKIAFSVFIVIVLALASWYLYTQFQESTLPNLQKSIRETVDQESEVFTPPPLKSKGDHPDSQLTKKGIRSWTNKQRVRYNLRTLSENNKLTQSAQAKAQDMLENQYFAHQSPDGDGVSKLAARTSYSYLIIGENLALGNFKDDEALVTAWMNSQGHRENILKEGYREIGIGLIRGDYKGDQVWLAVQHFGTPKSVCNQPSKAIKNQIDSNNNTLEEWKKELNYLKQEIESTPPNSEKYSQLINEYNKLTEDYNNLLSQNESLIESYNQSVADYNQCLNSYK